MNNTTPLKLVFIINPNSGNNTINYREEIEKYFHNKAFDISLYDLPEDCNPQKIKQQIDEKQPDKVIAVGGDGTVKLVAEAVLQTNTLLGILPAGSANGMAKELGIPDDINDAFEIIINGTIKKISLVKINDEHCIHLSDIGFNAFVIKKFETLEKRGMWSYIKAAWMVLKSNPRMDIQIQIDDAYIQREAAMVVIANATRYGTGVVINPKGSLEDDLFEVVIVKKISFIEIFKMRFTHASYDPKKTELHQTRSLQIKSKHAVHFQVDGEYLGKLNNIKASIMPAALQVLVPQ